MQRAEVRAARRGFSLLEMVMVIAIFAILAAVAVPLLSASTPQQRLREAASDLVSNIRLARSMAVSGQTNNTVGVIDAVDITFNDAANSYSIVVQNLTSGNFAIVKTVNMNEYGPAQLDLVPTIAPTPTVRFAKNGSADRVATITLTETTILQSKAVEVTRAGLSRISL